LNALHFLPSRLRLLEELEIKVRKFQPPSLEDGYLPRPSSGELDSVSDGDDECRENGVGEGARDGVGVTESEESEDDLPDITTEYPVSVRSDKGKTATLDRPFLRASSMPERMSPSSLAEDLE